MPLDNLATIVKSAVFVGTTMPDQVQGFIGFQATVRQPSLCRRRELQGINEVRYRVYIVCKHTKMKDNKFQELALGLHMELFIGLWPQKSILESGLPSGNL